MNTSNPQFLKIRQALIEDLPRLMEFVETEWKSGHIFARDESFFRYEYQCGKALNFIVSETDEGAINGMLGFIPSSNEVDSDVWTTMWKVSRDTGNPVLGIHLLQYLKAQGHRTVMSLGINQKTIGIYQYLGYATGSMNQHFLPNNTIRSFMISKIPLEVACMERPFLRSIDITLRLLSFQNIPADFFQLGGCHIQPRKDLNYVKRRYFEHPIFCYRVYGIYRDNVLTTLLVTRVVHAVMSKALRLVDIIGDESLLPWVTHELHELLKDDAMEYMDLVSYGLDEGMLQQACLSKLDLSKDQIVIPNYFEPFMQKNIVIYFFVDGEISADLRLFKADGDQDRPS
jgi:hypothetical protein